MGKVYSDEEIATLGRNPNVSEVARGHLSLTLSFRQQVYDAWLKEPIPSTIKRCLEDAGIDPRITGKDFYCNLGRVFKKSGRPSRERNWKPCSDTNTEPPVPEEPDKTPNEGSETPGPDITKPGGRSSGAVPSPELPDDFIRMAFERYPGCSISQSAEDYGIGSIGSGYRVRRLEKFFSGCKDIGTTPFKTRGTYEDVTQEQASELRQNPFVQRVNRRNIRMGRRFYKGAAGLYGLDVDRILDTFCVDPSCFTLTEKTLIMEALGRTNLPSGQDEAFGGTGFDAFVLRRRIASLDALADKEFERIRALLPRLTRAGKKELCLALSRLPEDPEHVYTTKEVLKKAGISRSAYYKYVSDPGYGLGGAKKREKDQRYKGAVRRAFFYKGFRKGARQICMLVPRLTGEKIGLKKVRKIMKELGLDAGVRKANPMRAAARVRLESRIKPDILRRRFRLHRPNEVRVTDVTYLDYAGGRAYGSALMDPVTGRLVAFHISGQNDLDLALETLRRADSHPCIDGGIFHSDQGILYQSEQFQKEVLDRGLRQSMSKKGNCWDNATQESFFGHFKDECDYSSCQSIEELRNRVDEYADYYNNERGMWEKGRMTPAEYENYLSSMSGEAFGAYLAIEEEKYQRMKERAAVLARKRYGTLGIQGGSGDG